MSVTRFSALQRPAVLVVIGLLVLAVCALIALSAGVNPTGSVGSPDAGDRAAYDRIIEHMRAGQDYYAAARVELIRGHYGMQSVFNWRTPLLASFVALSPSTVWPQAVLLLIAIVTGGLACKLIFDELGAIAAGTLVIVEIVTLGICLVPDTIAFAEVPAGVLIMLSAVAYGGGHPRLGQGAGILALFLRELAGPYVLICLFLAWRERRYGECRVWIAALVAYAGYFAWHYFMVKAHQQPGDLADPNGWIQFGGLRFLLNTATFNGLFFTWPSWASAVFAPFAVLGVLAWPGRAGARIGATVMVYLTLFSIVGQHFDNYWGAIYAPLMSVGIIWAPAALRDLWRVVCGAREVPATSLQPEGS